MLDFYYSCNEGCTYPIAPFHPDQNYPEFHGIFNQFDKNNSMYAEIRNLFIEAGYDVENAGSAQWNPFRGYVPNGGTVVIKPNLVYQETGKQIGQSCMMTHASVIRPILDYLFLLRQTDKIDFRIVIADVPIQGADFSDILYQTGLQNLKDYYFDVHNMELEIADLRHKIVGTDHSGFYVSLPAKGDPLGYSKIHLENSFLDEIAIHYKKFGAPGYGLRETYSEIESTGRHYYHIPNTILAADLFINIPKLKTHKKAGITIALKNLIGINGEKAWIPHYRRGSIKNGGDEFDNKQVFLKAITTNANVLLQGRSKSLWLLGKKINSLVIKRFFRRDLKKSSSLTDYERKALFLLNGNWYGNDTLWRPILDLNYLLFHYDNNGQKSNFKVRKYICITDGIVAGEGDGPVDPQPRKLGLLALSENPVINDVCLSKIMGFDWTKIPQLKHSVKLQDYFEFNGDCKSIKILQCDSVSEPFRIDFQDLPSFNFLPPPGWIGHIELNEQLYHKKSESVIE